MAIKLCVEIVLLMCMAQIKPGSNEDREWEEEADIVQHQQ